jgi:putative flippase GtrA
MKPFGKFLAVGLSNTALSSLGYLVLVRTGTAYRAAGALAFAAGAANGYALNRRWTFGATDSTGTRVRYLAVALGGLLATDALLWVCSPLGSLAAYVVALPLVTFATFAANRGWTFT